MKQDLMDKDFVKKLFKKKGIAPKHSAGQHFLICPEVIEAILQVIKHGPDGVRLITELGSGAGALTQALLAAGCKVRAIEKDARLAEVLKKNTPKRLASELELIEGDLRDELWEWNKPYMLVGNIPYNLSGLIIRRITQLEPAPIQVVLLVQHEVGQRLTATAPNLHLVSLAVQLWGSASKLLNVPRDCFWPQPQVDSQLVVLSPGTDLGLSKKERERVLALAKIFFQAKRKQVGGVARRFFDLNAEEVEKILRQAGISSKQRPQEVTVDRWRALAGWLAK